MIEFFSVQSNSGIPKLLLHLRYLLLDRQSFFFFKSRSWRGVLDTALCDKVCQFSPGTPVCSTNKTDRYHDITGILLKVALNIITITPEENVQA